MKSAILCSLLAIFLAGNSVFASPQSDNNAIPSTALINVDARHAIDLSGEWNYIVDPQKIGILRGDRRRTAVFEDVAEPDSPVDFLEYNFNAAPVMEIPGDWNGRDITLTWFEGLVWFRKVVELDAVPAGRSFLHVGAANYRALVHVNGEKVGEHEGGFTPFAVKTGKHFIDGGIRRINFS